MVRMTASEAFVETLAAQGVTDMFGIVGSAFMEALDIFEPAGIRFWPVAHEQNAAHMADATAGFRTGTVSASARTPRHHQLRYGDRRGLLGTFTRRRYHPAGGFHREGLGGFQETDQMPIFSKITKYQVEVKRYERIAELTHRPSRLRWRSVAGTDQHPARLLLRRSGLRDQGANGD